MIVYEKPTEYRGTIEVYVGDHDNLTWDIEWRWRCKSRNSHILASGEGYKRRAGALNAIDAQYAAKFTDEFYDEFPGVVEGIEDETDIRDYVVPWRLVIHDRHGNIEHVGAVY